MAVEILRISIIPNARFSPGQVVITRGIEELIQQGKIDPGSLLRRHLSGDWGDIGATDRQKNDAALASGEDMMLSAYQIDPRLKIWIITEWDRSVTTLLLPSEY